MSNKIICLILIIVLVLTSTTLAFASTTVLDYAERFDGYELNVETAKNDESDIYKCYIYVRRRSAFESLDFQSVTFTISYGSYSKSITASKEETALWKSNYTLFSTGYVSTDPDERPVLTCTLNYATDDPVEPLPPITDYAERIGSAFRTVNNMVSTTLVELSKNKPLLFLALFVACMSITVRLLKSIFTINL